MAKLVEVNGYTPGREVPIEDTLLIGRNPGDAGLVLPNKETSRRHAKVTRDGEVYRLQDLKSANGTLVEGHPIESIELVEGMSFTIGRTTFRFSLESPHASPNPSGSPAAVSERGAARRGEDGLAPIRDHRHKVSLMQSTDGAWRASPSLLPGPAENVARQGDDPRKRPDAVWNLKLDAHSTRLGFLARGGTPNLREERDVLEILCEVSRTLGTILHLPTLVQQILSKLFELFPAAENASIHLLEDGSLEPLAARSRNGGPIDAPLISQTIAQLAISDRQRSSAFFTSTPRMRAPGSKHRT